MTTEKEWSAAKTLIAEISRGVSTADIERTLQSLDQFVAFRVCTVYGWAVGQKREMLRGTLRRTRIVKLKGGAFQLFHAPVPRFRELKEDVARYDCEELVSQLSRARREGPYYRVAAHYRWLAGVCWEPEAGRTQAMFIILETQGNNRSAEMLNLFECQLPAFSSFVRDRLWSCPEAITNTNPFELTPRQKEVLRRTVGGAQVKEIAAAMGISERTVSFHLSSIYRRMNVSSRHQAIALALRRRLFDDSDLAE